MLKKALKSVRAKLFITLCVVILMIIGFFVIINNAVLEALYYYSKKEAILNTYEYINTNIQKSMNEEEKNSYELELEKVSVNNTYVIPFFLSFILLIFVDPLEYITSDLLNILYLTSYLFSFILPKLDKKFLLVV